MIDSDSPESAEAPDTAAARHHSVEYTALRHMYVALVCTLAAQPGFGSASLVKLLARMAADLHADGDTEAAALLEEVQIGLALMLGD